MNTFLKGELITIHRNLSNVTNLEGVKLLYARQRNLTILKNIISNFSEEVLIPKTDKYLKFEEEEKNINIKFATDSNGIIKTKQQIVNNVPVEVYDIDVTDLHYIRARKELFDKYADEISNRNQQIHEYNKFMLMEHEDEIKFFKIPVNLAPTKQSQYDAVSFMIADMTFEQEQEFNELFSKL